jgi:hypothetical protein
VGRYATKGNDIAKNRPTRTAHRRSSPLVIARHQLRIFCAILAFAWFYELLRGSTSFCAVLRAFVGFCGLLWAFAGFCGLLRAFAGFCGLFVPLLLPVENVTTSWSSFFGVT